MFGSAGEKEAELTGAIRLHHKASQLKSKDLPIAHWGVHGCGQIFGFEGFLANSENLCACHD